MKLYKSKVTVEQEKAIMWCIASKFIKERWDDISDTHKALICTHIDNQVRYRIFNPLSVVNAISISAPNNKVLTYETIVTQILPKY